MDLEVDKELDEEGDMGVDKEMDEEGEEEMVEDRGG